MTDGDTPDEPKIAEPHCEESNRGLLGRLRSLFRSDAPECKHVEHCTGSDDTFPDEDASIWYVLEKTREDSPRWSETDAAYIKLQDVMTKYVCLGCGATREIHTAERVGGRDGIKLKEDMSDEELAEFQRDVHSGAFYNGFPS